MILKTIFVVVTVWCIAASGGVEQLNSVTSNQQNDVNENIFTWESVFEDPVVPNQIPDAKTDKNPDVTSIQTFLSNFGKSLDHCNMKIEETAEISKYLIRRFMREVIEKQRMKNLTEDSSIDDIPLDEIDFQEQVAAIPDEIIDPSEGDENLNITGDVWDELNDVLETLREACDNLPISIADIDLNWQRLHHERTHTVTVLEEILKAMTIWTNHWAVQMQNVAGKFIDSCMALPKCEKSVRIIADIVSNSLKKTKTPPMAGIPGMNLNSLMGSSAFWNAIGTANGGEESDVNGVNSYLRLKLQKMAGILGHFGGISDTEDVEYVNSSGVNTSANEESIDMQLLDDSEHPSPAVPTEEMDDMRMRRMMAAAVNVLRFPWNVDQPNKAVLVVGGSSALREVPPTFLSLALESQLIQKPGEKFDMKSDKVRTLMAPLSPAVFRLGGSSANYLTYDPSTIDVQPSIANEDETNTQSFYRAYPYPLSYHSRDKNNRFYHEVQSLTSHPKMRKRSNDVGEMVERKLKLNDDDEQLLQNSVRTHPKFLPSLKNEEVDHQEENDDSMNRVKRSLDLPARQRRSIDNIHPKMRPHRNSLRHVGDMQRRAANCDRKPHFHNYTMTDADLSDILDLCAALNWTLLFDLNQFPRTPEGDWDPTNARQIIRAVKETGAHVIWQLGNEPNSYAHKTPLNMTGPRMAGDVRRLRKEVHSASSLWQRLKEDLGYTGDVSIVGPDVTRPRNTVEGDSLHAPSAAVGEESMQFLREFLAAAGDEVDAVTWHQYYVCGRTATAEQFTSPSVLDLFRQQLQTVTGIRDQLAPGTPVWITETGSAYGGGAPGLSNRFAGVFLWLDKLGLAAIGGADVVARQSLWGGHYAMLGADYDPNPDYWVSVLHKRLVGGAVLQTMLQGAPDTLRLYAHCSSSAHPLHAQGGAVVFGINTAKERADVGLLFQLQSNDQESHEAADILQYLLTPALGDLTARTVLLNGAPLEVGADGELPSLEPVSVTEMSLPGHSAGFWLVPGADLPACQ